MLRSGIIFDTMVEKKFTAVLFNRKDSTGDIILPGAIKSIPDKGLPIMMEFDTPVNGLCIKRVEIDKVGVHITASVPYILINGPFLWPAIGFRVIKSTEGVSGRIIQEMDLKVIGLSINPNADPEIKPIQTQEK